MVPSRVSLFIQPITGSQEVKERVRGEIVNSENSASPASLGDFFPVELSALFMYLFLMKSLVGQTA